LKEWFMTGRAMEVTAEMKTLWGFGRHAAAALLLMLSVMAGAGRAGAEVSERLVTLETQQKPLKEVLQRIAGQTGCTFLFDGAWSNYPVSVRLEKATLQTSLRRVLASVNHALVYLPDRTVKIIITESTQTTGGGSAAGIPARARRPTPPNPEPPAAPEPSNPAEEPGTVEEANPAETQPPSN
jgi:type II secretory pathway component GspD/PulD (secretin)